MKINNKGYASTIIMFSILTLFLISMLMLVKTMSNSSSLNKKITEKVVDNIDYDASGTVQGRLNELEIKYTNLQNQLSNTKKEIINEIYPVGSIYISEKDDTVEKIQSKFGGTWEKYAQGRTLIGEGTTADTNGNALTYNAGNTGGSSSASISHSHTVSNHSHTYSWSGKHSHELPIFMYGSNVYFPWNVYGHVVNLSFKSDGVYVANAGGTSGSNTQPATVRYYSGASTINVSGTTSSNGAQTISYNGNVSVMQPYITVYMYKRVS